MTEEEVAEVKLKLTPLGAEVLDLLLAEDFRYAATDSGRDGFYMLMLREQEAGRADWLAIALTFEGALHGMSTPGVRRQTFMPYTRVLTEAGYAVARHETNDVPHLLIVARDQEIASQPLAALAQDGAQ